jgi:hypothetical protein
MSIGMWIEPVIFASAKRDLIKVASVSENKVLAKSFVFLIAFAVGDKYFSNRYGGKYIRLLKTPMEALSSSAKFRRSSSKGLEEVPLRVDTALTCSWVCSSVGHLL